MCIRDRLYSSRYVTPSVLAIHAPPSTTVKGVRSTAWCLITASILSLGVIVSMDSSSHNCFVLHNILGLLCVSCLYYTIVSIRSIVPVSYTHLDVYKRQHLSCAGERVPLDSARLIRGARRRARGRPGPKKRLSAAFSLLYNIFCGIERASFGIGMECRRVAGEGRLSL